MTQKAVPQTEEDAIRVELFRTQAVGIVGPIPGESLGPANGETFLALKSAGMEGQQDPSAAPAVEAQKAPAAPPAPAAAAQALKMPAAAKAAMTEALGAVIDGCAKMAEALQAAEVDDAAPVPMELVQMAADVEDQLGAMVEPYEEALMAATPPPAPTEGEPAQKAADAGAGAAAAAPPPAKPRPRIAMKRIMALDNVAKSLIEGAAKVGELVGWAKGSAGMPAPAMKGLTPAAKAELDPYTAVVATADAVKERMYCIRDLLEKDPAAVAAELRALIPMVDNLAMLVTQARSGATAPAAAATAAPAPGAAPAVDAEAVTKAVAAGVESAKGDLLAAMRAELSGFVVAAKGAAAQAQAALSKVEKSVPAPNGQPAGENPTPPMGAPPPADPWASVNKDIQQARSAAAGK